MSYTFGPFKRTAQTLFKPTLTAQAGFGRGSIGGDKLTGDEHPPYYDVTPPYHDVSTAPTRRPPTSTVFKRAAKDAQERKQGECAQQFQGLMNCIGIDGSGKGCANQYAELKICMDQAKLESGGASSLSSKKYHIERVYGGLGSKTRQRRGKGQK
jgi:hypothetical protein